MPFTARLFVTLLVVLVAVVGLSPAAVADPDIDSESAAAVVQELREQGYDVQVNGVPSGDAALLTTCKVTAIHNVGDPPPDPSSTTVSVDVACPIQR